jgi:choline dehydrogenase-like flavoprotein
MRRPDQTLMGLAAVVTGHPALRRTLEVWSSIEQAPDPANRVELSEDLDPLGVPRPRIVWGVGADDERTYRVGRERLLEELRRLEPGLTEIDPDHDPWPAGILGTWHHLGTTRMDDDPTRGVVDRDARVHGMANLFVAGSSVFPVSGAASPTITLIELSLRLADHLAAEIASVPAVTA